MIFSENRCTLFRIMRQKRRSALQHPELPHDRKRLKQI
jgi:hypothetical protein